MRRKGYWVAMVERMDTNELRNAMENGYHPLLRQVARKEWEKRWEERIS